MGGEHQLLAAVCTLAALVFLADGSEFSPDSFDQLWWSLLAYFIIRVIKRRAPKLWIVVGLVVEIGLLTKLTIFFFVVALVVSFLAIPSARKYLRSKWLLTGGLLSFALILLMIYWNLVNGWPIVQFYLEFRGDVGGGGPLDFFSGQLSLLTFLDFPIAIMGVYFYLRWDQGRELRALGLSYILLYIFMTVLNVKPYYLAPVYPMLFAGGALMAERSLLSRKGILRLFGSRGYVAALVVSATLFAPLSCRFFLLPRSLVYTVRPHSHPQTAV